MKVSDGAGDAVSEGDADCGDEWFCGHVGGDIFDGDEL